MTESASEFIDIGSNIDDAKPQVVMDKGSYNLVIQEATLKKDNGVVKGISVRCDFTDHPDAATLFVNVPVPMPADDAKKRNNKTLMLQKFMKMFHIPYEGGRFNIADFAGAQAMNAPVDKISRDKDKDGMPYTNAETGEPEVRWSNNLNLF